jgi:hypothetical protein
LAKSGGGKPAGMEGALLAEGDHFFRHGPGGAGLGQGGGNPPMFNQAGNQIRQHSVPVGTGSAKFGGVLQVTHKLP